MQRFGDQWSGYRRVRSKYRATVAAVRYLSGAVGSVLLLQADCNAVAGRSGAAAGWWSGIG